MTSDPYSSGHRCHREFSFLALTAVLLAVAGQLFFAYYVGRVGYRVDVKAFGEETRTLYGAWLVLGAALPVAALIVLFIDLSSVVVAAVALLSYAASLALWQAFFSIAGKEVLTFPQYEKDLSSNYF